jgi:Icc-related predicted phosphoesterase
MRVLHYSDRNDKNFLSLYKECDVLVSTGDLTLFDFGGLQDVAHKKPAFGVYGNHCSGNYFNALGIVNLHNKAVSFAGLVWGGWQGCLKYKNSEMMYTEEEALSWSENFGCVYILLLHAGPKEMLDDPSDSVHTGSESVKRYVLNKKPKYVFCGHQYSNAEMEVEGTKIFRTYGARIVEI